MPMYRAFVFFKLNFRTERMIKIRRGLDLPISGSPEQAVAEGNLVKTVALVGFDYNGMKPTMTVREGDVVTCGQVVFEDKKNPGVVYTAPASGKVVAINRGHRRVFESLVINVEGDEAVDFGAVENVASVTREQAQEKLVASGLWTAFRTRPYSKVPALNTTPNSIFVTAIDTNPLAADPRVVIAERKKEFANGLALLEKLTDGRVFVCQDGGENLAKETSQVEIARFGGKHPAGLAGTHIHYLDPVSATKTVWSVGYQDVIAIGALFATGKLDVSRVVSLAGPQVKNPRLVRTRLGANLNDLTAGELAEGDNRIVSGSVLGGRTASDNAAINFLGRYHVQVSSLLEGHERPVLHYIGLGLNRFSATPVYMSSLFKKLYNMTTSCNGSERAMVPIGNYERVMPLDILATHLLRAIVVADTESAQQLGALELDEEDLALLTFVCPGKHEFGPILRDNLTKIELEG